MNGSYVLSLSSVIILYSLCSLSLFILSLITGEELNLRQRGSVYIIWVLWGGHRENMYEGVSSRRPYWHPYSVFLIFSHVFASDKVVLWFLSLIRSRQRPVCDRESQFSCPRDIQTNIDWTPPPALCFVHHTAERRGPENLRITFLDHQVGLGVKDKSLRVR